MGKYRNITICYNKLAHTNFRQRNFDLQSYWANPSLVSSELVTLEMIFRLVVCIYEVSIQLHNILSLILIYCKFSTAVLHKLILYIIFAD